MRRLLPIFIILLLLPPSTFAQQHTDTARLVEPRSTRPPLQRFYVGSGLDGLIFSNANVDHPGFAYAPITRFTAFFNAGLTLNYNVTRFFGGFTGIDVKNVGFTLHDGNVLKYRTYNVGVPLGIRVGSMMPRKFYIFFGGGVDFPVNYKEKNFVLRAAKDKFYEWFSKRTTPIMPYVFAGFSYYNLTLKAQYYPLGFFNEDYVDNNGDRPYANYNVHLYYVSLGYVVRRHGKLEKSKSVVPTD